MTSVEATKRFVETAQVTPFEARGQVFVIAAAESLSPGAADALLKNLEEPFETSPRHFLLLAPSQFDLSPTLRSRSLAIYLGAAAGLDEEPVARLAAAAAARLESYWRSGAAIELMATAGRHRGQRRLAGSAGRAALGAGGGGAGAGRRSRSIRPAAGDSWIWPRRCSRRRRCGCAASRRAASSRGWSSAICASRGPAE